MADELLARQYVEFIAKGLGDVQSATDAYKKKLEDANKAADGLNKAISSGAYRQAAEQTQALNQRMAGLNEQARKIDLQTQFGKTGAALHLANEKLGQFNEGAKRVAGPAAAGFAILTGAILGFVRAGLAGTVEGNRLTYQFQMLSREIAGVFMPVIEGMMTKLAQAVAWFRTLSGEKQNLIMRFALASVAALAFAMVLPRLVGGIQLVIVGVKALMTVIAAAGTEAGIASGGILPLLGILVTAGVALTAFLFATKSGSKGLGEIEAAGRKLIQDIMPSLNRVMGEVSRVINSIAQVAIPAVVEAFKLWATWIEIVVLALEKLYQVWRYTPAGILFRAMAGPDQKSTDEKNRKVPTQAGAGFEDFIATYQRIASAAAGTGQDPVKDTADNTKETASKLQQFIELATGGLIPLLQRVADKVGG
jgi:hypothetical protein